MGLLWSLQQQFVDGKEHSTAAEVTESDWSQSPADLNGPVRGLGTDFISCLSEFCEGGIVLSLCLGKVELCSQIVVSFCKLQHYESL